MSTSMNPRQAKKLQTKLESRIEEALNGILRQFNAIPFKYEEADYYAVPNSSSLPFYPNTVVVSQNSTYSYNLADRPERIMITHQMFHNRQEVEFVTFKLLDYKAPRSSSEGEKYILESFNHNQAKLMAYDAVNIYFATCREVYSKHHEDMFFTNSPEDFKKNSSESNNQ